MSTRSLEVVCKWSEHVQRQHAPSNHTACAGWVDATLMLQKLMTTHSATVNHGCARRFVKPRTGSFLRQLLSTLRLVGTCLLARPRREVLLHAHHA